MLPGKPKNEVQPSVHAANRGRILHLHAPGVSLATSVDVHLQYGKYLFLENYLAKIQRPPAQNTPTQPAESEGLFSLFDNTHKVSWGPETPRTIY